MRLSKRDVDRLMRDRTEAARAATAAKVAAAFASDALGEGERRIAEDIFRLVLDDAAVRVRAALADAVKHCARLPHDVAVALANDVGDVALPVIECSAVLTDADLLAIVAGDDPAKQVSVARRAHVSADVSDALIDSRNEEAVATLVANEGAEVGEGALHRVIDAFSDSERVSTPLAYRRRIPTAVAERLVALVSDHLREHLLVHHELPVGVASDLVLQSRERATMALAAEHNASELVRALAASGRLTPSIITRALCMGDLQFFEWAIAALGRMPIKNARLLIHDRGPLGLRAAFDRAGLPQSMWSVVRAAVDVAHETELSGGAHDRERFSKCMIERIVTRLEDPAGAFADDDLKYLLDKLSDLVRPAATAA